VYGPRLRSRSPSPTVERYVHEVEAERQTEQFAHEMRRRTSPWDA